MRYSRKMTQEIQQPINESPRQPKSKSGGLWNKIIILVVLLVIIGGIVFVIISIKHPTLLETQTNKTQQAVSTPTKDLSSSSKILIFIVIGGVLFVIGYLVFKGINKGGNSDIPKVPVAPDRAEELFTENFSLRYNIECIFDGDKKLYKPASQDAISLITKHPYFHTATGDNFLLMEIEVTEGKRQGIHMVILPIDKGEETIKGGWYRIDTNTPKHVFALNRINYPMSSMADKSDRMKLAMLDRADDPDKASDVMKSMTTPNPNTISTPLDGYGGDGMSSYGSPARRSPARRKNYSSRRSYR
jgi:hypothetical protein